MTALLYSSHKAGLSICDGNFELADFYMHEMEESLEAIGEVESYDGHRVGKLSRMMATPVEAAGGGLDDGDGNAAMAAFQSMISTCNACHAATAHAFIKIEDRSNENPFMQSFN